MASKNRKLITALETPVASSGKDNTVKSFDKIYKSLFLKYYRLSYFVGKHAIKVAGLLANALENIWTLTLSDAFDKVKALARNIAELKRSRVVRGEVSITRGIFTVAGKTGQALGLAANAFITNGPVSGLKYLGSQFRNTTVRFCTRNRKVFNYLAPVAGMAVLALTIYFWSNVTMAVSVSYNGKVLGTVASEKVFREAARTVETNISEASGTGFVLSKSPVFSMKLASKSNLLNENEIYDDIISASGKDVTSGYGLYVDNTLVGTYSDNAALQTMLDSILAPYKDYGAAGFYQDVQIKKGVYPKSIERTPDTMKAVLTASAKNSTSYTVQKGDSPEMVANRFHVSTDQLYAMNNLNESDNLTQGQSIMVDSNQPTLLVKYTRRETSTQSVPFQTISTQSDKKAKGTLSITQKGKDGVMQLTSDVTYVGNTVVDSKVISTQMVKAPVNQYQTVGTSDFSQKAASMIDYAENFLGGRYVWGGATPSGFDCSGFTMYVFSKYGVSLPHSSEGQAGYGTKVSRGSLQAGDLVFFGNSGGINHVGIYIGNNQFVNAENARAGVTITSLNTAYWSSSYVTARRVIGQ